MYETFSGMLSRHNTHQLPPEQTRISSALFNGDMRMWTPCGTGHYLAECYSSVYHLCPFPDIALVPLPPSPAPELSPIQPLLAISMKEQGVKGKPSKDWKTPIMYFSPSLINEFGWKLPSRVVLKGKRIPVCVEAEKRSHPFDLGNPRHL